MWPLIVVENEADATQSSLNYVLCVNKVLDMQRVFLTERETDDKQPSDACSMSVPAGAAESTDASMSEPASLTVDTTSANSQHFSVAGSGDGPSQSARICPMDLSELNECL